MKRYFIRRLTRLEPPYLISMPFVFAAKFGALDIAFPELFPNLLAALTICTALCLQRRMT